MSSHEPVLADEIVNTFKNDRLYHFFDGTLGAGGHAKMLLSTHEEIVTYYGCDQDPKALDIAKETLSDFQDKVCFLQGNFSNAKNLLLEHECEEINGCLLDLGVSSMQLDEKERGFSFSKEAELDMRMDPTMPLTAREVVNKYSEKALGEIFRELGEEREWRKAAKAICIERKKKEITTTTQLAEIIEKALRRKKKIHSATLVFQGLRIFINDELGRLEKGLKELTQLLVPQGKIVVLSYHSLEDRIVKNFFRTAAKEDKLEILTKKPLVATREEMKKNRRSRSAKLRIARVK